MVYAHCVVYGHIQVHDHPLTAGAAQSHSWATLKRVLSILFHALNRARTTLNEAVGQQTRQCNKMWS
jgi:hypothetical protein